MNDILKLFNTVGFDDITDILEIPHISNMKVILEIFDIFYYKYSQFLEEIMKNTEMYQCCITVFLNTSNENIENEKQLKVLLILTFIEQLCEKCETYMLTYTCPDYFELVEKIEKFYKKTIPVANLIFTFSRRGQLYCPKNYHIYCKLKKNINKYFE